MKIKSLKVDDIINLKIDVIGEKGDGIGFYNKMAVIVKNTEIGNTYEIKITKVLPKFVFGEMV